jgi:hypothetical protein
VYREAGVCILFLEPQLVSITDDVRNAQIMCTLMTAKRRKHASLNLALCFILVLVGDSGAYNEFKPPCSDLLQFITIGSLCRRQLCSSSIDISFYCC